MLSLLRTNLIGICDGHENKQKRRKGSTKSSSLTLSLSSAFSFRSSTFFLEGSEVSAGVSTASFSSSFSFADPLLLREDGGEGREDDEDEDVETLEEAVGSKPPAATFSDTASACDPETEEEEEGEDEGVVSIEANSSSAICDDERTKKDVSKKKEIETVNSANKQRSNERSLRSIAIKSGTTRTKRDENWIHQQEGNEETVCDFGDTLLASASSRIQAANSFWQRSLMKEVGK